MNLRKIIRTVTLLVLALVLAAPAMADMVKEGPGEAMDEGPVVVMVERKRVVKKADNFVYLFDLSGSLSEPYDGGPATKLEVLKDTLLNLNAGIPDLDYNTAMYSVAPEFESMVPFSRFDRDILNRAILDLPEAPRGYLAPTPLGGSLKSLEGELSKVSGKTIIYLFTDGRNTDNVSAAAMASRIAKRHDACFLVVSVADKPAGMKTLQDIVDVNECSKVLPFDEVIRDPSVCAGALCEIR